MKIHEHVFYKPERLVDEIVQLSKRGHHTDNPVIWRGQASAAWGLVPSLFRTGSREQAERIVRGAGRSIMQFDAPDEATEQISGMRQIDLIEREMVCSLVDLADEVGTPFGGVTPETLRIAKRSTSREEALLSQFGGSIKMFPTDEMMPVYSLAQHYGLPTRLIDFSHRPLTALYFAARSAISEQRDGANIAVWGIHQRIFDIFYTTRLRLESSYHFRGQNEKGLVPIPEETLSFVPSFISAPSGGNPNLAAQAGCFLCVRSRVGGPVPPSDDFFECLKYAVSITKNLSVSMFGRDDIVKKFAISSSLSRDILLLLREIGYSEATMFPGLESCVEQMKVFGGLADSGPLNV